MVETSPSSQPTFKLPLCIHLTSLFHKSTSLHIPNELLSSLTAFLKTVSVYYNIYSDISEEDIETEDDDEDVDHRRTSQSYRKIILHHIDPHHLYFEPYGQIPTCKNKTIHIGDDLDDYLNNHNFIYLRPFQLKSDYNDIYLLIPSLTSPTSSSSIDKKNTQSSTNELNLQALAKELILIYQLYEKEKTDIGEIIQAQKKKVLSGITCTFSGVIPIEQEATQHRIWKLAHHYGADLSYDLTGKVTHLIATMTGTTKVNKASHYSKIHIVTLSWLLDSISRWQIQFESLYPLISSVPPSTVVTPVSTPLGNDDLDDDVDDEVDDDNNINDDDDHHHPEKNEEEKENEEKNKVDIDDHHHHPQPPSLIINENNNMNNNNNEDNDELISLQPNEIHEIDKIDWDEADKEVNDYIYESGTDDYISSGPDSPLLESNRKRKPVLLSNSRKKNKPLHSWSLRQTKKLTERGPSKLSTTTLFHSLDNHHNIDQLSNSSLSSDEEDVDDEDDDDDDTSFLNILAGELDNEIE